MFWLQALGVLTPFHATQLASPSHLQAGPWQVGAGGGCEGASALPSLRELPWCSCVLQSVVVPRCRGTAEALQIDLKMTVLSERSQTKEFILYGSIYVKL